MPGLSIARQAVPRIILSQVFAPVLRVNDTQPQPAGSRSFWSYNRGFGKSLKRLGAYHERDASPENAENSETTTTKLKPIRPVLLDEPQEVEDTRNVWVSLQHPKAIMSDLRFMSASIHLHFVSLVRYTIALSLIAEKGFLKITQRADDTRWIVHWRPNTNQKTKDTSETDESDKPQIPDLATIGETATLQSALEIGDEWLVGHFEHQSN